MTFKSTFSGAAQVHVDTCRHQSQRIHHTMQHQRHQLHQLKQSQRKQWKQPKLLLLLRLRLNEQIMDLMSNISEIKSNVGGYIT